MKIEKKPKHSNIKLMLKSYTAVQKRKKKTLHGGHPIKPNDRKARNERDFQHSLSIHCNNKVTFTLIDLKSYFIDCIVMVNIIEWPHVNCDGNNKRPHKMLAHT